MVLPKVVALSVQLIIPVAGADRLPQLDVEPVCKGIAEQGGVTFRDPAVPKEKKNCIESERAVREQLSKQWSSFSADDRTHCLNETTMGGESSNTELLTCLEMARDVRATRAEATASRAAPTRSPSSPSQPNVQPAPAERASRPTSAKKPPKLEVDSTLKELEPANADAKNAKASEVLTQRKLADAEAVLRRTKVLTDFQTCLTVGSVFPQIARLHHLSPFCRPSSVAHIDFQAIRSGWLTCSAAPRHPC